MTNSPPGPDGLGLFINPYNNISLETHLAMGPSGQGSCVRYWNESICLAQTALINNSAMHFLGELIAAAQPHRLLMHCLQLDIFPVEYLFVRDIVDPKDWGMVFAQIKPAVLGLCFMSHFSVAQYGRLLLMARPFLGLANLTSPNYLSVMKQIDKEVSDYTQALFRTMITGSLIDNLQQISMLKMLSLAEAKSFDLATLFKAAEGSTKDVVALIMSRMSLHKVALCHMAMYHPEQLLALQLELGPIVDSTMPEADAKLLQRQIRILAQGITEYTQALLASLNEVEEDRAEFTDQELKTLFKLV